MNKAEYQKYKNYYRDYGARCRDQLRKLGICTRCHKNDAIPGQSVCTICRSAITDRQKRLKETGMCVCCGKKKAMKDKIRCKHCIDKVNQRNRERSSSKQITIS